MRVLNSLRLLGHVPWFPLHIGDGTLGPVGSMRVHEVGGASAHVRAQIRALCIIANLMVDHAPSRVLMVPASRLHVDITILPIGGGLLMVRSTVPLRAKFFGDITTPSMGGAPLPRLEDLISLGHRPSAFKSRLTFDLSFSLEGQRSYAGA